MQAPMPEKFRAENDRIAKLWLQDPDRPDMGEFIEKHASEEFKAYCRESKAHAEEMERMGIMAG